MPGGGATDARGAPALIREATEGDRRAILGVYADVFGADDAETKRVASLLNTHEAVCSWVAEIGGEVVGHAMVTDAHLVEESGRRGLVALRPIVVRSSHRRRGLGGALARRTIDEARCLAGILLAPVPAGGVAKEGWLNAWAKSLGLEAGVALGFWTQEADTDLWAMRLRTTAEPGQGEVAWP
ncbi:MAG: GNAT family N-acetyltransferase [Planctomycetota bacterium]